jgi:C4-dicarboxylate-specific signal transduction histidine kinase
LIINAVEAMSALEEGPRELLISTERTGADGISVAVRDSGPGLSTASLEQVFDAFYTTKRGGLRIGRKRCPATL